MDAQDTGSKSMRQSKGGIRPGFWFAQASVATLALVLVVRTIARDPSSPLDARPASTKPSLEKVAPRTNTMAAFSRASRAAKDSAGIPTPVDRVRSSGELSEGAPYVPGKYLSRLAHDDDDFKLWTLDPRELAWLLANQRQILTQDLETVPEPTGGLRVIRVREGSFGALRGLRPGDTVLEINGEELDGPQKVEDFLRDPAYQTAKGWRVRVHRNGTVLTIDYRADS